MERSFDWSVTLDRQATSEEPAAVRLALTNTGPESVTLDFGVAPPFTAPVSGQPDASRRLVLYDPEMGPIGVPSSPTGGCCRLENDVIPVRDLALSRTMAPDESVSDSYWVYDHPGNAECFPDGEYTFTDRLGFAGEESTALLLEVTVTVVNNTLETVTGNQPQVVVTS